MGNCEECKKEFDSCNSDAQENERFCSYDCEASNWADLVDYWHERWKDEKVLRRVI